MAPRISRGWALEIGMWWYLTLIGAAESDGPVPDEDIISGRAVPGWTFGGGDSPSLALEGESPDVFVAWLERDEPDPSAAVRQLAGRPSDYVMRTDPVRAWARMGPPQVTP